MNPVNELSVIHLPAVPVNPSNFAPFGQVIRARSDGQVYDPQDANLVLDRGIPRFYIMRLQANGRQFHRITRHQQCTQCLGALGGNSWLLAVAAPTQGNVSPTAIHSFVIDGDCFVKLHVGTWHAGPYFVTPAWIDFYNLELADTNIEDHHTIDLQAEYGVSLMIDL
jgi:ureidoglycolate hydrolase